MLETIRAAIISQQFNPDFDQFYLNYMMKVQDTDIDNEISYLFRKNKIDASNLCTVIEDEYQKLVNI